MPEFAANGQVNKGPTVAELQRIVKAKTRLEIMLVTGKSITGILKWCDEQAFCVLQDDHSTITLFRSGIIGYKLATEASKETSGGKPSSEQRDTGSQKQFGSKKHGR